MKTIVLISLFALVQAAHAAPFPYPTIIAPTPTVPNVITSTVIQCLPLTSTLPVYSAPVPAQAAQPAAAAPASR